ncbi:MAG: transposase, partial [Aphanocapsa sp. GSE-SYN-MK-11-07L]|nr:transposase [Aphanocapsa sp. GSE-SYN-MK-11-07L]
KKTLDQRVHRCSQCGCVEDRDVAAAKVMLNWAIARGSGDLGLYQNLMSMNHINLCKTSITGI